MVAIAAKPSGRTNGTATDVTKVYEREMAAYGTTTSHILDFVTENAASILARAHLFASAIREKEKDKRLDDTDCKKFAKEDSKWYDGSVIHFTLRFGWNLKNTP